jgi:nucleoside 2-deoxyribosyltransferase
MNKTAYLAGPMEKDINEGIGWRRQYEKELKVFGIDCIVPNDIEAQIKEEVDIWDLKSKDIDKHIEIIRQFIKQDLKIVEKSDMLIVKWEGQPTAGTIHEVGYAYQLGKPCYLISKCSNMEILSWFLACFTKKFYSFEEFKNFLKE